MTPARRIFVLLGAYEELTERETAALRCGDMEHADDLERRKLHLADTLIETRRIAALSPAENDAWVRRVRSLEVREASNLAFLREESARIRAELTALSQAALRSRDVRRGYAAAPHESDRAAETILGRA